MSDVGIVCSSSIIIFKKGQVEPDKHMGRVEDMRSCPKFDKSALGLANSTRLDSTMLKMSI